MQELPVAKWQCQKKGQFEDLSSEISDRLESALRAGEMMVGVWDNGLFREFDLAKMQEIPGLKLLKRVDTKPATPPSPSRNQRVAGGGQAARAVARAAGTKSVGRAEGGLSQF